MEKKLILGLIIILFLSSHVYAQSWEHISTTMGENSIHHISVDELNPLKLFAASERHLYVTDDGGKTWEKIFQTIGEKSKIHFITSSQQFFLDESINLMFIKE